MEVTPQEEIYTSEDASVTVLRGVISGSNVPVVIKEELYSDLNAANHSIQEGFCMARIEHPNVCRIYDCRLRQERNLFISSIVMEYFESDLGKQIERRLSYNCPWTEDELLRILEQLVSALHFAQDRRISHRDIKPQNIFCSLDESTVKIGDFGSATKNFFTNYMKQSLAGTPLFFSPQLKHIFLKKLQGLEGGEYDSFKSDVYSLGTVFLFMARLKSPVELMRLDKLPEMTESLLSEVSAMQTLADFLRQMLQIEEANRPDFSALAMQFEQRKEQDQPSYSLAWPQDAGSYTFAYQTLPSTFQQAAIEPTFAVWPAEQRGSLPQGTSVQSPRYIQTVREAEYPPGISVCPSCRKPFRSMGTYARYCSLTCTPMSERPSTERLLRCTVCLSYKAPLQNPPPSLAEYFGFAAPVCSATCLQKFKNVQDLARQDQVCVHCKRLIGDLKRAVQMPCRHCIHDKDCFFLFIELTTNYLTTSSNLRCPHCHTPLTWDFVQQAFGADFQTRRNFTESKACCVCGSLDIKKPLACGHSICGLHKKKSAECAFCKRNLASR